MLFSSCSTSEIKPGGARPKKFNPAKPGTGTKSRPIVTSPGQELCPPSEDAISLEKTLAEALRIPEAAWSANRSFCPDLKQDSSAVNMQCFLSESAHMVRGG